LLDDLVAQIVATQDWDATLAWAQQPGRFDGIVAPDQADDDMLRAMATMFARSVWNVTPLPANRFRPRPLAKPQRNAPCPCGSGRKYKRCCQGMAGPELDTDTIWLLAVGNLDAGQIAAALAVNALPLE